MKLLKPLSSIWSLSEHRNCAKPLSNKQLWLIWQCRLYHWVAKHDCKRKLSSRPSKEPEGAQVHGTWWGASAGPPGTGGWSC